MSSHFPWLLDLGPRSRCRVMRLIGPLPGAGGASDLRGTVRSGSLITSIPDWAGLSGFVAYASSRGDADHLGDAGSRAGEVGPVEIGVGAHAPGPVLGPPVVRLIGKIGVPAVRPVQEVEVPQRIRDRGRALERPPRSGCRNRPIARTSCPPTTCAGSRWAAARRICRLGRHPLHGCARFHPLHSAGALTSGSGVSRRWRYGLAQRTGC